MNKETLGEISGFFGNLKTDRKKHLRVDSRITSPSGCKMSSTFGTFADRLGEVILERSLKTILERYVAVENEVGAEKIGGCVLNDRKRAQELRPLLKI